MTQNIEDLHVYLRSIRPNERTSLSVLAGLVHDRATVLDLGCGSGALGQYLLERHQCTTDGLTWSDAEAQHAAPHYRKVVVADLETCDLTATFPAASYDYIVCADVLEHLRHPEKVLAACRQLLKPEGRLLISVPNANYAGLVAELLQGEFRYRDEGLLDRTHLRFFTRRSLARFLGEQRWAIQTLDTIRREMPDSEFSTQFDQLPPAVARYLASVPDALTYQFVGAAAPVEAVVYGQEGVPPTEPTHALFTAQLYVAFDQGYQEEGKRTATGIMGQERQTVSFDLPPEDKAPLTAIRLDPADRAGYLHLYAIRLLGGQGQVQWEWNTVQSAGSLLARTPSQQMVWQGPLPSSGPTLVLLTGDDPWFELPIPPVQVAGAARLEVDLGWPMSADYLALSAAIAPLQDQIAELGHTLRVEQRQRQDVARHLSESQAESAQIRVAGQAEAERLRAAGEAKAAQLQATIEQLQTATRAEAERLRGIVAGLKDRGSDFERNAVRLQYELTRVQSEFVRLQNEHVALVNQFKTLESSILYRATRPLASAKRSLKQMLGSTPQPQADTPAAASQLSAPPAASAQHPVDIIVPVYRGLADTRLCIESVLASPLRGAYRLIVINDCSPEPEVTDWLRQRAAQDDRITLLENEENLGFVGTVNRGMALSSTNDVLLLNSDTEVANDWLDRIRAAAHSHDRVASVTPFSTNATICSYPRYCEDNPLPPGYDTARLDALCARTNPGVALDVPTGVGFCMYIRRDCLQQVGLFDTANFGKGYGEENDFCQRAAKAGWRNLHLLDTFVLHTGGVSFGDSKSPREQAAMETLARLHPNYAREVHAFVQSDPARPYRLAMDAERIAESGLPVIVNVMHDRAGGTLRHVRELAEHLLDQAIFLTLSPAAHHSVVLRLARKEEAFELTFQLDSQYEQLLAVLRRLGVRHVHFHHLLGHGQAIRELPHRLAAPYDFTAHDYFSYCTHISLTGDDNRYLPEPALGQCACCKPDMGAPSHGTVAQWRGANASLLNGARHVIAPSHDAARRIAAFVPAVNVLAIPHTDVTRASPLPVPAPAALKAGARLKIVVIGALSVIKGADVLEAVAVEAAKRKLPVEFHLLGYGYRQLKTQPKAHLTIHGGYAEEDLPGLIEWLQPDLAWFPAQWPETYSYTLSAALQAGLPVAVGDLGAFAERIYGRPWSWICPWDQDAKAWLDLFMAMRDQNFATGTAPTLEQSQPDALPAPSTPDWHYRTHYLQDLPTAGPLQQDASGHWEPSELASYVGQSTAADQAKAGALGAIVYLRSLPGLRSVARAVPAPWRRRVKSWFKA